MAVRRLQGRLSFEKGSPVGKPGVKTPSGARGRCRIWGPLGLCCDGIWVQPLLLPSKSPRNFQTQPYLTVSRGFVPKPQGGRHIDRLECRVYLQSVPEPLYAFLGQAPSSVTVLPDNYNSSLPGLCCALWLPSIHAHPLQSEQTFKNINQIMSLLYSETFSSSLWLLE